MSTTNGKPRGRQPYLNGARAPIDHDAEAPYSRAQLLRMDRRFVERMERAIERGLERPPDPEAPERAATDRGGLLQ